MRASIQIRALAHPVNTLAHHTIPPGFRWAVYVGENWADMDSCLNAGWEPTLDGAAIAAEAAAVCAAKVALMHGTEVDGKSIRLDHDPIEQGNDRAVLLGAG